MTKKAIITGGGHTGKTTLWRGLQSRFPEAAFTPEPATEIMQQYGQSIVDEPRRFCILCIEQVLAAEEKASRESDLIIMDRSLIDTVAYLRRDGGEDLLPELEGHIQAARYSLALLCDPVGVYATSDTRYEPSEIAKTTHNLIVAAYEESGLEIVQVPALPISKRADLAATAIAQL
jgi:predicted ATPase